MIFIINETNITCTYSLFYIPLNQTISGSLDKTAFIQSFKEDRLSREFSLKGHEDAVDQLAWHPTDPNILSTVSSDKTLRIWDIRTPQV